MLFKNYTENEAGRLVETLDYWSRDMLNFNFSEKGLGLVSPPHFVYDFEENCSINWPKLLTRLWRHKIWNLPNVSYQAVFLYDEKLKTNTQNLENEKSSSGAIKSVHHF